MLKFMYLMLIVYVGPSMNSTLKCVGCLVAVSFLGVFTIYDKSSHNIAGILCQSLISK